MWAGGLDRYAAMENNSVRYVDATGHMVSDGLGDGGGCDRQCWDERNEPKPDETRIYLSNLELDGSNVSIGIISAEDLQDVASLMDIHIYQDGGLEELRLKTERNKDLITFPVNTTFSAFACLMTEGLACALIVDGALAFTNYVLPEIDVLEGMKNTQEYFDDILKANVENDNFYFIASSFSESIYDMELNIQGKEAMIEGINPIILHRDSYNDHVVPYLYGRIYQLE